MQSLNSQQMSELDFMRRTHPKPYVRVRAMALWNLASGKSVTDVADFIGVYRHALVRWRKRYEEHGIAGLEMDEGRGRKSSVDEEEVLRVVSQSPRNFGLKQERWTLETLRDTVPSLRHLKSLRSVGYVLERMNLAPKRGQYRRVSPDPEYDKKKRRAEECLREARENPQSIVVLYEDEASLYRQPSQGWLWAIMGRSQPRMSFSHKSNTRTRVVGVINAVSGRVHHWQRSRIDRKTFARFILSAAQDYTWASKIYVVLDNWPVHFHPDVFEILSKDPRIELIPLPTYAPWLNYIEKLWRWLRQTITHAHPYADDFNLFKQVISEALDSWSSGSPALLKYVGLSDF